MSIIIQKCRQCNREQKLYDDELIEIGHESGNFFIHKHCWLRYHNKYGAKCTFCISEVCIFADKAKGTNPNVSTTHRTNVMFAMYLTV